MSFLHNWMDSLDGYEIAYLADLAHHFKGLCRIQKPLILPFLHTGAFNTP